jgi:hypothetical protein
VLCYYYRNDSILTFSGSVNLCGGGTAFETINPGDTSTNCLSSPPSGEFSENGSCT